MNKYIKIRLREGLEGKAVSVAYLKQLKTNTSNASAKKFLNSWIGRAQTDKVSLSPKEVTILGLIKNGGPNPKQFSSKNENTLMENVMVQKKMAFDFEDWKSFNTLNDALKEIKRIYKSVHRKNNKANADMRPNAFGAESLPWFIINDVNIPQFDMKGNPIPNQYVPNNWLELISRA